MRIQRLDLLAFGPFTDASLRLDQGHYGLHLIYGPNEAGKSSALRGLTQLLFGIPHKSSDIFVHPNPSLRIGGLLQNGQGETFECVRRKGNAKTLRAADDQNEINAAPLHAMLAGIDEHIFTQRFGISYENLVAGGEAIALGKGELNEVLFAAGSGIANLRGLQQQLANDAEQLFKERGATPAINKALSELAELKREIKEASLATADWKRHDKALADATRQREQVEQQLFQRRAELERLKRFHQALPLIAQRGPLSDELATLTELPHLARDFSERRSTAIQKMHAARSAAQYEQQTLGAIEREIETLEVPSELLRHQAMIDYLHTNLGKYQQAVDDRPELVARHDQLSRDASAILEDLGDQQELAAANALRIGKADRLRIQELARQQTGLTSQLESLDAAVRKLARELAAAKQHATRLPASVDLTALTRAVQRARQQGDLDEQLETAEQSLLSAQERAAGDLRRLGLWTGTLDELEALAVPSLETIGCFEDELAQARDAVRAAQQQIEDLEQQRRNREDDIERLRLQQDVPTEADLAAARELRERGWQLVRQAWLDQASDEEQTLAFQTIASGDDLPSAYEASVAGADDISDRLRREAQQVAAKSQFIADRQRLIERLDDARGLLDTAQDNLSAVQSRWQAIWTAAQIEPQSPREMRTWLSRHAALLQLAASIREASRQCQRLREKREMHRRELLDSWAQSVDNVSALANESLADLLRQGEAVLKRSEAADEQRRTSDRDVNRLRKEQAEAASDAERAQRQLADWRAQWQSAVARIGVSADASPSEALGVLASVEELGDKRREMESLQKERIEAIDQFLRQFAEKVRAVAAQVDDGDGDDVAGLAQGLVERLGHARQLQSRVEALTKQQNRERERLASTDQTIRENQAILDALCQEAGVSDPDELPQREAMARRRDELERDLRGVQDQLVRLAAGASLDEFIRQAAEHDADQLPPAIRQCEEELAQLEEQQGALRETIGAESAERDRMDGTSRAAEAIERREMLLAGLRSDAEEYARLRLASAVLRGAMEQYRERHQGPVLSRASRFFAQLTCNSFSGLRADYNDKGEAVLMGVRADGRTTVPVAGAACGMSDGTCDQLYLALRLASLETWLADHTPIPFVVDDVLVNFDDQRAAAALRLFGDISQRTQIILFTHHQHLLELAQRELSEDVLFVHRLAAAANLAPTA